MYPLNKLVWSKTEERTWPKEFSDALWDHRFRYMFARPYCVRKRILDCGCGVGYGAHYLAASGAKEVTGIDFSEIAVKIAKKRFQSQNIHFMQMDATKLKFEDASFDIAVSFEVIEHLQNPDAYLSEMCRVLKKGSIYIGSTPNKKVQDLLYPPSPNGKPGWKWHVTEYTNLEYKDILTKYFKNVKLWNVAVNKPGYLEGLVQRSKAYRKSKVRRRIAEFSGLLPNSLRTLVVHSNNENDPLNKKEVQISEEPQEQALFILSVCET